MSVHLWDVFDVRLHVWMMVIPQDDVSSCRVNGQKLRMVYKKKTRSKYNSYVTELEFQGTNRPLKEI